MNQFNYTIVVAEDEELLLDNLIQKIQKLDLGFDVVGRAQTGLQAYEIIKELEPDLVITDIRMPILDGLGLIEKIRNRFPDMKCVIVSGFSDFEYAKTAIRLHVSEYLLKPIDPEELQKALLSIRHEFEVTQKSVDDIFNDGTAHNTPEQIGELLKNYLTENYNLEINLNLIADNMNYSPSYLTRLFCQQFGVTPLKYISSLRIAKAKHLLKHNPNLSVRQIGEMVGYQDQAYFSRFFKKQTGVSPADIRK